MNKSTANLTTRSSKGVSVVVCCYNSELVLPKTLLHLSQQQVPESLNWEVIVVDNASTDQTSAIAKKIWDELGNSTSMQIVLEKTPGLSAARRKGTLSARFDTLIFCDDDNWLASDYVNIAATLMEDDRIGVAGGIGRAVSSVALPDWFATHQRSYAVGPPTNKTGFVKSCVYGAGMVLRTQTLKSAYEAGFESLLSDRKGGELSSGGDSEICEWCHIIGGRNWFYSNELKFKHFIQPNRLTKEYLKKLKRGFGQMYDILRLYRKKREGSLSAISQSWLWRLIQTACIVPALVLFGKRLGQNSWTALVMKEHLKWLIQNRKQHHDALTAIKKMYNSEVRTTSSQNSYNE